MVMARSTDQKDLRQTWDTVDNILSAKTKCSIAELNFSYMMPVQAACIPLFLGHKDVAAEAVTGSGKTLAFVIPIIEILARAKERWKKTEIGAIIITPTRELALQISEVLDHFLKAIPELKQADMMRVLETHGAQILVATPGRLDDLFTRMPCLAARVRALEVLVLDEADRLLDMGFHDILGSILRYLPKQRRTGLFSATQTQELEALIRAGLRNPVRVSVAEHGGTAAQPRKTPASLVNHYQIIPADQKFNQLVAFVKRYEHEKIIVFFSTCASVDYFASLLSQILKKSNVSAIHGKKSNRHKVFSAFRKLTSGVLMCTDVMGRGIDLPDVRWVVQFDPPSSASAFVHRCGRTARQGRPGSALLMLMPAEEPYVRFVELNQKVPLEPLDTETVHDNCERVRTMATKDRAIYEKGLRAFVSYIQAYAKHECNVIFRVKELDMARLAMGFGLLHLPRMPELKGRTFPDFKPVDIDKKTIPYKDKIRERQRQEKLKTLAETGEMPGKQKERKVKSESWSKQKGARNKRRERKVAIAEKKRKREEREEDAHDSDLERDSRMLKKLKQGKITKEEYDAAMDLPFSDSEEED